MTAVAQAALLVAIYSFVVVLTAGVALWVKRRMPPALLCILALAPLLFVCRGVLSNETLLPVDHAMLVPPWNTHPEIKRYNPYLNDLAQQILPWAKAVRQAWAHGLLPLRDRWNGCGMTLAGNGQSTAFSPLMFLTGLLPLAAAFALMAALKMFLALTGMWLWLKELKVSSASALFGAVAFGFSLTILFWLFSPISAVESLWPWVLFSVERLRDRAAERRAFWLLVAVLTALPLGGHIESAVLGCLFAALFVAGRWLSNDLPEAPRMAGGIAAAAAVALGLTAFDLLPQVLAILSSNRIVVARQPFWSPYFAWLPHGPIWPGGFTTILPRSLGDEIEAPMIAGAAAFPEMALGHIGIVGWACAFLIFRPGSKRRTALWVLFALILVGFGIATAIWPFVEIVGHMPMLKYIFPLRFLAWVALAGAAAAALELDRLVGDMRVSKRAGVTAVAVAGTLGIAAVLIHQHVRPLHVATGALSSEREALWLAEAALVGFALCIGLAVWKGEPAVAVLSYGLAILCGGELWIQGTRFYRSGRIDQLFPPTPLVEFLRKQSAPFRVVGEGATLFPNSNIFAGVEDVRTHDAVERRDYVEFLDATCGYPPSDYFKQIRDINATALDFLNVRYLVSMPGRPNPGEKWRLVYEGADGTVFENRDALPRVFSPNRVSLIAARAERAGWIRNAFTEFGTPASAIVGKRDWRDHAFVLGRESKDLANGSAEIVSYQESTNEASFRVRVAAAESGAFLVTSLVQDGGWSAYDDAGRVISTTLANGPFLALHVPGGDHAISLAYWPPGFRTGMLISVLTLFVTVTVWARAVAFRWKRRSRSTTEDAMNPSHPGQRMSRAWLAGATAVMLAGLALSRVPLRSVWHIPVTPLDFTSDRLAHLWTFLHEVRGKVPDGATYTVLAPNRDDEMYLYMLSLGLLDRQEALPSSYFGVSMPNGHEARYVLSYGNALRETEQFHLVFRAAEGAVYERVARR